jgi:hypothetical protein
VLETDRPRQQRLIASSDDAFPSVMSRLSTIGGWDWPAAPPRYKLRGSACGVHTGAGMGGSTALLSRSPGSMDLLQGTGCAAAIGARGAHLAASDDPERRQEGLDLFWIFSLLLVLILGKWHPDPIC